ncbi:MAG: fatty acyl-AMP ligase [Planctomycetes bacterium RBG_16_64_12]|nr:MAG: fatty acyl-AMP ligase [Planctomycetes bacterium RBG_16_64_12]
MDHLPGTFFGPPNLVELVRHRARHQPQDTAFTFLVDGEDDEIHLSNRELDRQARAIGAWLESLNLVGQRALLLYPPGLEFIAAFFGCLYAGVVAVPAYPPRRNRSLTRIQAIADDAQAAVALTTDVVLRRVEPLIHQTPHLKELTWLATCHVPEGMDERWEMPDVHGDTLAFLQYTSGSTGTPKGVMLNHANLIHNSALIAYYFELTRSGMGVFWLPSYHDMGLIGGILQPLYLGVPNILMSPMAFLQKPFRWLHAITRFGGTTSGGPNFAYDLCVQKITAEQRAKLDLSSWKVAFNGAEPVREETIERFVETFGPCGFRREAFFPCFGLAEATLIVSGGYANEAPRIRSFNAAALGDRVVVPCTPDENGARKLVGCGQAVADQKIVIADPDTMTSCPEGQIGEIWVNGPSVALGYWRRPEATEATFQACLKDTGEGPFLRTGDLGFMEAGELFVTGRIKDLIILHGVNIYPQDVERTVQESHPRLLPDSTAVFTVEGDGREQLVVVQELERRSKGDLGRVFEAIRRAVSREHELAVDAIVLVKAGSIPKTSSNKIQRHACRDGHLNGSLTVIDQWHAGDAEDAPLDDVQAAPVALAQKSPATNGKRPRDEAECTAQSRVAPEEKARETRGDADRAMVASTGAGAVSGNGKPTTELVLEQVRLVARDRAAGLTLDSAITEIGLDSLERMEIMASLEEQFGGRFPEEILPELETCREVVAAVDKYLGGKPRPKVSRPADAEIPPDHYRFDQFPEYVRLKEQLDLLDSTGLGDLFFTVHESVTNDRTIIGGREMINFSNYNYLGMSGDPVVTEAAQEAVVRYGTGVSASRLVSGQKPVHVELERTIARFLGTDDAIVFVCGHSTNETVIGHLLGPGDLVLHDALAHNSILQGSILSGARRRPFAHNDWRAADRLLEEYRHEYRRAMIVIEGVYSMDGDIPELPKFIEVKKRHKALLMIDEAHSVGVLGPHGRGIGEHFDVDRNDVDVWMGTVSKALGSCGGYIAGSGPLVEYLKYTAPGFVFSNGISPALAAAATAAIRLLEAEPHRAVRLQQRARLFLELAKQGGLNTGMSKGTPVVPVILGNSLDCLRLSKAMAARGVNVQPILHPAVEEKAARLRFFLTSLHTEEQIRYTIDAMVEELEKINPEYLAETSRQRAVGSRQ